MYYNKFIQAISKATNIIILEYQILSFIIIIYYIIIILYFIKVIFIFILYFSIIIAFIKKILYPNLHWLSYSNP